MLELCNVSVIIIFRKKIITAIRKSNTICTSTGCTTTVYVKIHGWDERGERKKQREKRVRNERESTRRREHAREKLSEREKVWAQREAV